MSDPLPADVRKYLEARDSFRSPTAQALLAKYPKPPEPWPFPLPPRFHDHAEWLRSFARQHPPDTNIASQLRAIADDIDPEVQGAT